MKAVFDEAGFLMKVVSDESGFFDESGFDELVLYPAVSLGTLACDKLLQADRSHSVSSNIPLKRSNHPRGPGRDPRCTFQAREKHIQLRTCGNGATGICGRFLGVFLF